MPASSRRHSARLLLLCFAIAGAAPAPGIATPSEDASKEELRQGFEPLFDGRSLDGWHAYRGGDRAIRGWEVIDGAIVRVGGGGDLVSDRTFGDFELRIDWKIAPGGNSGIFYRGDESEPALYWTAIEYQVLDDARHPDAKNGTDRHAAAVYGLYPPGTDATRPAGEWNQTRIVARGAHVEHWLNGVKVVEFELWTPEWKARVAASKFRDWPNFGAARSGHIGLQDHGDRVSYRNIRIRPL